MAWTLDTLTPAFGIELSGQRLNDPALPQSEKQAVFDAVTSHGVAVVRGQDLSDDDIYAFACSVGTVIENTSYAKDANSVEQQKVFRISNLDKHGEILPADDWMNQQNSANERWHIDSTYLKPWHFVSMLYGREVPPEGADTQFCDTRLLWDALSPEEQAWFEGRTAQHSLYQSRRLAGFAEWSETDQGRFGPVERPLVAVHPPSGRKALWIASHIESISGMDDDEAVALVAELSERLTAPERCYSHHWQQGDLLIWDNRAVMHRAMPYKIDTYRRDMRTVRLVDLEDA
jgi:alpha-ketoglutarate-dependent 2,4-dichlorophenoxyacetate dioxygenase